MRKTCLLRKTGTGRIGSMYFTGREVNHMKRDREGVGQKTHDEGKRINIRITSIEPNTRFIDTVPCVTFIPRHTVLFQRNPIDETGDTKVKVTGMKSRHRRQTIPSFYGRCGGNINTLSLSFLIR